MKQILIIFALLTTLSTFSAAEATNDESYAWTVGTDQNGQHIQQVEWLFKDRDMTTTNCPIWAGTQLTIIEEHDRHVKVKCDKDDIPNWHHWNQAILEGDTVIGWIDKARIVRAPKAALRKIKKNAQPGS